jgi:membrane protein
MSSTHLHSANHQGARAVAWHRRLADVLRETAVRAGHCQVFAHSGNIAFRAFFALFPAIIALLWLLRVVHSERLVAALLTLTDTALPHTASEPIRQVLTDAPTDQTSGAFTLGALAALGAAGWSLGSMTRAMMNGLNAIYGVEESRPFWRSTAVSLLLAAAVSVLLVMALFLVVFGRALAQEAAAAIGWGPLLRWAWQLAVWPVLISLVLCACALIYHAAPDVQQRSRWVSMGAVSATAVWLHFSVLYSIYMNRFASYEDVYGTVAGIIVLMAYGYTSAFILLLGAVLNQVLEERQPAGKHAGEHTLQTRT